MCGLVGAFRADASSFKNIRAFIAEGLFMNTLRGAGGTGVGVVPRDFDPWVSKTHASAPFYLQTGEWAYVANELDTARAVLGHTRAATTGNQSTQNSHPFMYENEKNIIMLTHNGHVNNWTNLTPHKFTHSVDSAHVAYSMLLNGAIPTLEKVRGYYVFIWYDDAAKTINIARDGHRDFAYAISDDGKAIYYASEKDMLRSLLERNHITVKKGFREIEPYLLHTWSLEQKTLENPKKEKYEEKKFGSYPGANGSGSSGLSGPPWRDSERVDTSGLGSHTRHTGAPYPRAGERIWVNASDAHFSPGNFKDPQTNDPLGNIVDATYDWDYKSIVTVVGVMKLDWENKYSRLKGRLPCIVDEMERIDDDTEQGKISFYRVHVNKAEAERDLENLRKEDERKRRELSQLPSIVSNASREPVQAKLDARRERNDGVGRGSGDVDGAVVTLVPGPGGTLISEDAWQEMAQYQCFTCSNILRLDLDAGRVIFFPQPLSPEDEENQEEPEYRIVCPVCAHNQQKMETMLGIDSLPEEKKENQVLVL